jgi:predicted membrane metal-binding protein
MDGIAAAQARIQQILSQFGEVSAGGVLGTGDSGTTPTGAAPGTGTGSFADALAQAQGAAPTATAATAVDPSVPTSSGKLNRAGVDSIQWARDFLKKVNMPITSENVRAVSAWEQAEGTAASFNPLATTQSGFAGETRFNSVGVKNYATYQDGIDANAHALLNGRYTNVLDALRAGNSATAVAQAISDSPWGTHGGVLRVLASQGK